MSSTAKSKPRACGTAMAFAACLTAACSTTPPPFVECRRPSSFAPNGDDFTAAPGSGMASVTSGPGTAQIAPAVVQKISLRSVRLTRSPTGNAAVVAEFGNCSEDALSLRVRTHFLGAEGWPVEAPSAWRNVHLRPRSLAYYEEFGVSGKPEQVRLEVVADAQ